MTDPSPTWSDLIAQTWPAAEKLANRIEQQHLAGNAPQGVALIALAILLGRSLALGIAPSDVAPVLRIVADIAASGGDKPTWLNH